MKVNKSTSKQDPLSNYFGGGNDLTKLLKTSLITTLSLIIIIVITRPPFSIVLLLIAIVILINAHVMKAKLKQKIKMLIIGLVYATAFHYIIKWAGMFGSYGIIIVMFAAIMFKLYRVKKRINKIFDEVKLK